MLTLPKERIPPIPKKKILIVCLVPLGVIAGLLITEWSYLVWLSNTLTNESDKHHAEIKAIVNKYPDRFTPDEVNATKYRLGFTITMVNTTKEVIDSISYQLLISIIAIVIFGSLYVYMNSTALPTSYSKKDGNVKTQHYIDSIGSVSTSISAAISVGITIVGAVSLLSPSIVGGYIIAGLQTLLICLILGILTSATGSVIVDKSDSNSGTVTLKRYEGARWEAIVSMQLIMLMLGIALLVLQIITI